MPHVVNGIGTWYYGKRNLQTHQGVCRACQRITTLSTYDTRLYVVVLMVPIIPLGRKRIIDQCAACSRHMVLPFPEWQCAQQRTEQSVQAWRRSPGNLDLAKEVLRLSRGAAGAGSWACAARSTL